MIVKCTLDFALQGNEATVVSDDTDILVLLIHYWKMNMSVVYFKTEAKKMEWKYKTLSIMLVNCLHHIYSSFTHGVVVIPHLPHLDKAKRSYSKSLTKSLKSYNRYHQYFQSLRITAEEVGKAGSHVFVILYGGKKEESLRDLRYYKYMDMVASNSTSLDPQKLPPTERAAFYHSLRVYLQIMLWKRLLNEHDDLDPSSGVGGLTVMC